MLALFSEQLRAPETRAAAWQWLREHFDAALARVPAQLQQHAPGVARFFCDEASAADAETFLAPRVQGFVGAPRNLTGALEGVRLCAARVDAQRASARGFFARVR